MTDVTHDAPCLRLPILEVRASFMSAAAEFEVEGRDEINSACPTFDRIPEVLSTPATFADFVTAIRARADESTPRPTGMVPQTTLWWTHETQYFGRLAIRHHLTPALLETGGHIGYAVRPSARRKGHATAMLSAGLMAARDLGITSALITCDVTNTGSRRVIETNGGVLEDQRGARLRYWVPT